MRLIAAGIGSGRTCPIRRAGDGPSASPLGPPRKRTLQTRRVSLVSRRLPGMSDQPDALEVFAFRCRDAPSGRWVHARHGAERAEIATRYADWEITGPGEERRLADDCSNPTRGRRPSSSTSPASASKGPSMLPVLVPALVKTARWWSFPTRYPTHDAARAMDLRGRWSTSPP